MAYVMSDVGGWGTGALGDVSNPSGQINSYANVTAISGATVTIGTPSAGAYETFAVGKEIMLHVSAVLSGTDATKLGKYMVATVTAVNGSVLTLSKDVPTNLVASADLTTLVVQAITIAQFNFLTLSSGQVSPPAYSVSNKYGGILLFKCKTGWNMSGSGAIYLADKGIPVANASLRPLTTQETEMTSTGKTTGCENHITARQLLLNAGDGVVGYWVKSLNVNGTANRIGSTAAGAQYYPYASGDNSPSEVLGGSTILAVAETITGWTPTIISKGKGTGAGYGRCYIATETLLPDDEGLYAQDCLSNPARLTAIGIKDFGDGSLGNVTNPTAQINSHAAVTALSGQQITIGATSIGGFGGFDVGAQIIVHLSARKTTSANTALFGKLYKTKILSVSGSVLTVADAPPFSFSLDDYYVQVITVPQFANFTLNTSYNAALAWDNTKKLGGICIVQTKGLLDASSGQIVMTDKGLPVDSTMRPSLPNICSGQQKDSLPLSQGGGAVLLLFDEITTDANSRFGGITSGKGYGGKSAENSTESGYWGNGATGNVGGSRGCQGNASGQGIIRGRGGCSLLLIGNKWNNFTLDPIATGGQGAAGYCYADHPYSGYDGGAGYCGGGGKSDGSGSTNGTYRFAGVYGGVVYWPQGMGGSGGGAGTCFIYVTNFVNPDWTGVAA